MSYETYKDIKDQQQQDEIVFILRGEFYETFEDDARAVSHALDLSLKSRPVGDGLSGERVALTGLPSYSFKVYAEKLEEAGYRYVTIITSIN